MDYEYLKNILNEDRFGLLSIHKSIRSNDSLTTLNICIYILRNKLYLSDILYKNPPINEVITNICDPNITEAVILVFDINKSLAFKDYFGNNIIHNCCIFNKPEIIKSILSVNKKYINEYNYIYETPLTICCKYKLNNIIKILISYGANINKPNKYNDVPLFITLKNKNWEMSRFILSHKPKLNISWLYGDIPNDIRSTIKQLYCLDSYDSNLFSNKVINFKKRKYDEI